MSQIHDIKNKVVFPYFNFVLFFNLLFKNAIGKAVFHKTIN